ncbi:MAG: hypothetical protein ACTSVV_06095 [Promethearchaeota archaeon]
MELSESEASTLINQFLESFGITVKCYPRSKFLNLYIDWFKDHYKKTALDIGQGKKELPEEYIPEIIRNNCDLRGHASIGLNIGRIKEDVIEFSKISKYNPNVLLRICCLVCALHEQLHVDLGHNLDPNLGEHCENENCLFDKLPYFIGEWQNNEKEVVIKTPCNKHQTELNEKVFSWLKSNYTFIYSKWS